MRNESGGKQHGAFFVYFFVGEMRARAARRWFVFLYLKKTNTFE